MITGLSHVSIVVPDIEAAATALADRYGLVTGERMVNAEQGVRLAYVELPGAKIELMEPSRPDFEVTRPSTTCRCSGSWAWPPFRPASAARRCRS